MYKNHQKANKREEDLEKSFDTVESKDGRETFPTPPQVTICSPPISVAEDDEDDSYSLMPQFSQNSTPLFCSPEEVPYRVCQLSLPSPVASVKFLPLVMFMKATSHISSLH